MAETEMDLTDRLNTARMEVATQNIAAENRSIHSQFVRFTLCKVIKLLLLGHCLLIAYGAFSEQLTLLHDLMQTAIITLFYNFVTATFARHTSIDFTVDNESLGARCVSCFIWTAVSSIQVYYTYSKDLTFTSFLISVFSTIFAVFSQAALLFFIQALYGNRVEEFDIGDGQSAVVSIAFSIANFYLCILYIVEQGH